MAGRSRRGEAHAGRNLGPFPASPRPRAPSLSGPRFDELTVPACARPPHTVSHRLDLMPWRAGLVFVGLAATALGLLSVTEPTLALEIALGVPFVLIVFVDLSLGVGL